MIVTEGPTLEEKLIKVTPWWDVVSKYLIAAMMAIALTSIVVQVTKDNVICVPTVDCSMANGSMAVNVSGDSAKLCQSLTPKSSKKKVLAKMVDRRFYDYVDSVCFQELSWFTKFFPLFLLGEVVLLLFFDILWTKVPYSSSVLTHFLDLADECYSSSATNDLLGLQTANSSGGSGGSGGSGHDPPIPEVDALKIKSLTDKASLFRDKYKKQKCLYIFYRMRTILQIVFCISSLVTDIIGICSEAFGKTFQCHIDEFVFTQEYDHFECSHPLAPYFQIAVILFLVFLCVYLVISLIAFTIICRCGSTYENNSGDDWAFFMYLLDNHDKLYADRVHQFFEKEKVKNLNAQG